MSTFFITSLYLLPSLGKEANTLHFQLKWFQRKVEWTHLTINDTIHSIYVWQTWSNVILSRSFWYNEEKNKLIFRLIWRSVECEIKFDCGVIREASKKYLFLGLCKAYISSYTALNPNKLMSKFNKLSSAV